MAGAAIVAAQAGVLIGGIVRTGRLGIALMIVVRDAAMSVMSVFRARMSGNRN